MTTSSNWYITFGSAHSDPPGLLVGKYLKVEAADELAARRKVIALIGRRWAFIYPEDAFRWQIEAYGLTEWTQQ